MSRPIGDPSEWAPLTRYRRGYRDEAAVAAQSEWARLRREDRKQYCNKVKMERGCMMCGYDHSPLALDFHHRIEEEKYEPLSQLCNKQRAWKLIYEEIDKCAVVCSNCHRILTWSRLGE